MHWKESFTKHSIVEVWQGFKNITLVLNIPRFWVCLWFWKCKGSEDSEHACATQGSEYVWICLKSSWICLIMPQYVWIYQGCEYAGIYASKPKSTWMAFVLHFTIVISYLIEWVITYFKVYPKLEVIVSRNMRLLSWRDKIWFSL